MTLANSESVEPIDVHDDIWFPLETILTHWIYLIHLGKVVSGLPDLGSPGRDPTSRSQIGLWSWLPYCDAEVASTIAAIERYSAAVESRMAAKSLLPISAPLFTDAELDATPRFKYIAPGLEVAHDKEAFLRRQIFTNFSYEEGMVPAVLVFAAPDRTANFNLEIRTQFFRDRENEGVPMDYGDPIPAGLYSEPPARSHYDTEEAGFRLMLPFALRHDIRDDDRARMSDGGLVGTGSFTDLFQHGWFYPFGGERRSQRMERLFDRRTELIESGVWRVGQEGVQGRIETFGDADNGNGAWRGYWIPPDS